MPTDNRIRAIGLAAIATVAIWIYALAPANRILSLTVMDVGEGLCVVMRTPEGKTMVVDCGTCSWRKNDSDGESSVLPYLRKMGVRQIDLAVLSHPHEDHVSGFAGLLKKCPPKLVMDIGAEGESPSYARFMSVVRKSGAIYRIAKRGQTVQFDDRVVVQVLSPSAEDSHVDLNDSSIVLRIIYGKTAFLIAGDAGIDAENEIINEDSSISAQVLLVGHHGSMKSTSSEWIEAVNPKTAVVSCGRNNSYGHPSQQTLDRLASFGARIYRTDQDGAVSFYSDGTSIRINTMTPRR